MRMKKFGYIVFAFSLLPAWGNSQSLTDSIFIMPDSVRPFTLENFYLLITKDHPVAKQAGLLNEFARQEIRLARGNFDPKIEIQYLTKMFDDTEYYNMVNGSLKFPSILPFDPSIGIEQNKGAYLNPERFISNQFDYQQFYAGVSLPLGRGLITDERRTALRQAELFRSMAGADQIKMINKLLLEAAKDYWQWYFSYYNYRLLNRGVVVANDIFKRVKINYELGEAAPVDTIQAQITLQQRLIEQQEAMLNFQNSGIQLSTYLWDSLNNPLTLVLQWIPVLQPDPRILDLQYREHLVEQARQNHPDLRKLSIKLQQLDVDKKLAVEFIKPKLDLSYYFLNQPFNPDWNPSFTTGNDYKFGLDFSFPILIRKERAKLAQAKLKINTTEFEKSLAERQIINDINATYNSLTNTLAVLGQQTRMVQNYERLLQAELLNLESGESDLFKINIQQEKVLQSQSKMIKLMTEVEKQKAILYWTAGMRNLSRD